MPKRLSCVERRAEIKKKTRKEGGLALNGFPIYIFGAHSRAITIGHYLTYLDSSIEILAYLFDNDEVNPTSVEGIPVIKIDENTKLDAEATAYIGTRGVYHIHIRELLEKCGIRHIIPVSVEVDMETRNRYLEKFYAECGRSFDKLNNTAVIKENEVVKDSVAVYVISSVFDRPLKNEYHLNEYEKLIQVGTGLTDKRINASYYDDVNENISNRNKQFCELTGLYWIWKNATEDIVGLEHYRRHFLLPDDWKERMLQNDIDVILPVPLYVYPNIGENFVSRHVKSNWENMLNYLKDYLPEDYEMGKRFFYENSLFSPCNMFIMKKEVLNDLCSWLFPILFAVADKGGVLADSYQNRYPGFISERLITYFFEKNRNKYKVVYADKNFLE